MSSQRKTVFLGIGSALAVLGLVLWFNRFAFGEMKIGDNTFPVRTSRLTGESEVCIMGIWQSLGAPRSVERITQLGPEEIGKIEGNAGIRSQLIIGEGPQHLLTCSVYNGTTHSLSELTIRLEIKGNETEREIVREYRLPPKGGGTVPSLSNGTFETDIGLDPESRKWTWSIVRAVAVK